MDRPGFVGLDLARVVDRLPEHVHDPAERLLTHGHRDRLARVVDGQTTLEAFRRAHRDRAHDAVAELLLHLEREATVLVLELERVVDLRYRVTRKLDVDHRANDLNDRSTAHLLFLTL